MIPPSKRMTVIPTPLLTLSLAGIIGCKAKQPSSLDEKIVREIKEEITTAAKI